MDSSTTTKLLKSYLEMTSRYAHFTENIPFDESRSPVREQPKHIVEVRADLYKEAVANLDVKFFTGEDIESTERHEGQVCVSFHEELGSLSNMIVNTGSMDSFASKLRRQERLTSYPC
jgi:hypothetical protein